MATRRYSDPYSQSYPPSVIGPLVTGATAGIPGTWTPPGARVPKDVAATQSASPAIVASPTTGWTSGQYVQTQTAGAAGRVTWTGTGWVGGAAPLDEPKRGRRAKHDEAAGDDG